MTRVSAQSHMRNVIFCAGMARELMCGRSGTKHFPERRGPFKTKT